MSEDSHYGLKELEADAEYLARRNPRSLSGYYDENGNWHQTVFFTLSNEQVQKICKHIFIGNSKKCCICDIERNEKST